MKIEMLTKDIVEIHLSFCLREAKSIHRFLLINQKYYGTCSLEIEMAEEMVKNIEDRIKALDTFVKHIPAENLIKENIA